MIDYEVTLRREWGYGCISSGDEITTLDEAKEYAVYMLQDALDGAKLDARDKIEIIITIDKYDYDD